MAGPCPCCGASPEHFADAADPEVTLQVIRAQVRTQTIRECQLHLASIHAALEASDAYVGVTRMEAVRELEPLVERDPSDDVPPAPSNLGALYQAVRHLVEGQGSAESYARAAAALDMIGGK